MRKTFLLPVAGVALIAGGAWAQLVQNNDISIMGGPVPVGSHVVRGTNFTVSGYTGSGLTIGYGYQVARRSAVTAWLEFNLTFGSGSARVSASGWPSYGSSTYYRSRAYVLGLRLVAPVHPRVSLYGTLGGGIGSFPYDRVIEGSNPLVSPIRRWQGVFAPASGIDFRLTRHVSVRGELRDFITGTGLGGASGRHHLFPQGGVVFHF